ncbi:toxin-antitoxin system YwqK family antitoxin [Candidatus Riflebacteria bacterium]
MHQTPTLFIIVSSIVLKTNFFCLKIGEEIIISSNMAEAFFAIFFVVISAFILKTIIPRKKCPGCREVLQGVALIKKPGKAPEKYIFSPKEFFKKKKAIFRQDIPMDFFWKCSCGEKPVSKEEIVGEFEDKFAKACGLTFCLIMVSIPLIILLSEKWERWKNAPSVYRISEIIIEGGKVSFKNDSHDFSGVVKDYYPNGKLKSQFSAKEGKKEGTEKHWFENGKLAEEIPWRSGQIRGKESGFYPNGQKKLEINNRVYGPFKGVSQKSGKEIFWYKKGKKKYEKGWFGD